jgi:hypothetical protein
MDAQIGERNRRRWQHRGIGRVTALAERHGDALRSTHPALRWEVRGCRHAAFATDFDYGSGP